MIKLTMIEKVKLKRKKIYDLIFLNTIKKVLKKRKKNA